MLRPERTDRFISDELVFNEEWRSWIRSTVRRPPLGRAVREEDVPLDDSLGRGRDVSNGEHHVVLAGVVGDGVECGEDVVEVDVPRLPKPPVGAELRCFEQAVDLPTSSRWMYVLGVDDPIRDLRHELEGFNHGLKHDCVHGRERGAPRIERHELCDSVECRAKRTRNVFGCCVFHLLLRIEPIDSRRYGQSNS